MGNRFFFKTFWPNFNEYNHCELWQNAYVEAKFSGANMKSVFVKLILSVIGGALISTPALAQQQAQGIAAVVNDDVITTWDLRQRAMFMLITQGIEPNEETQARIVQQAMRNLVDEKLQIQEAQKYEQAISDEAVDRGVESIISRNGISVDEFSTALAAQGVSIKTLREQVKAEIAWQRIIGGLYGSRIRISDAQINETLNRLSANANKPSYRVMEIYIEATPDIGGMQGAMEGAQAMIIQLQEGAPFQVLARQFSSSATAANGGEIGWVHEGELRDEIDTVIQQMEPGSVSNPITVPGGVYVIGLMEKKVSESEAFYKLKQINYKFEEDNELPDARTALAAASDAIQSCDTLADDIKPVDGVEWTDMGEIKASDLTDQILELLGKTNVGEVSEPLTIPNALVSIVVCERDVRGSNVPTRDEVEDRLLAQQEAQASKRHLRNLRRQATIVTR